MLDSLGNAPHAVVPQSQPNLQSSEAAREFDPVVPECERLHLSLLLDFDVVGISSKGCPGTGRIAKKQAATVDRRVKPFVRIERQRVSPLHAVEQSSLAVHHRPGRAVCAVNVKPEIVFHGHARDFGQGIDCSCADGPRAGYYTEGKQTISPVAGDTFPQSSNVQPKSIIRL